MSENENNDLVPEEEENENLGAENEENNEETQTGLEIPTGIVYQ
jgi:hypothetical protein